MHAPGLRLRNPQSPHLEAPPQSAQDVAGDQVEQGAHFGGGDGVITGAWSVEPSREQVK